MDFFEKFKGTLNKFTKSSAEVAREGIDRIGGKATEYSKITKIKMDLKSIEHKIDEAMTELGGEFYNLQVTKKSQDPAGDLKPIREKIADLKTHLHEKEKELAETYKEYAHESIDKGKIKTLKKELEEGGGTIEQIKITASSPVVGNELKNVKLPKEVLVGTILRNDEVIIPDGNYKFKAGDKVTLLGKKEDVEGAIKMIS